MKSILSVASLAILASSVLAAPADVAVVKRQCPVPPSSSSASLPPTTSSSAPAAPTTSSPPGTGSGGGTTGSGKGVATVYADDWLSQQNWPTADTLKGWDVLYLAFWMSHAVADNAQNWASIDPATQATLKSGMGNTKLMVSAFGATEQPFSAGDDPAATAASLAAWVKAQNMDGVDVDFEDLDGFNNGKGAEDWLISFTTALRTALPSPYIITHAPLAPWFQPGAKWGGGGYLKVDKAVGSMVDWYNVQFYNQGATEYVDCNGLFVQSSSAWPQTSVFEIIASGVDPSKIVIGKPATTADASNGFMDPATFAGCVSQNWGKNGWTGGVMSWQFPHADAAWIATVRGSTF